MLGGYANRVGWVDLTKGKIEYKEVEEDDARMYVGGRGLGVKYVFDNGPDVGPLSPDNMLCVMVGPLTGTRTRMSGRICTVTKSPLTGTITDSSQIYSPSDLRHLTSCRTDISLPNFSLKEFIISSFS